MRFSLSAIATAAVAASTFTGAFANAPADAVVLDEQYSHANLSERTFDVSWSSLKCGNVKGSYDFWGFSIPYSLGCICYADVPSICGSLNLGSNFVNMIQQELNSVSPCNYPQGSQPTCDGHGGYTCPSGYKQSDGTCSSRSTSCGWGSCAQPDGTCCPRGTKSVGGKCCPTTCWGTVGGECSGHITCPTGSTLGWDGKCKCDDPTKTIVNGQCQSQCQAGSTWNSQQNKCVPNCASGYTWKAGGSDCQGPQQGLCCTDSTWPCKTVCCPTGQDEVVTGQCCPTGSKWDKWEHKCIAPTGSWGGSWKKREQQLLAGADLRCPASMSACPVEGASADQYECVDTASDLQSCGGCASRGEGQDCTQIPGARFMGCEAGTCKVYSCKKGWKSVDGTCVRH